MSYDVLVIGGGPAGLSASINVRARGRSALVVSNPLEENPLWRAEKVDNYLGLPGLSGAAGQQLLVTLRLQDGHVVLLFVLSDVARDAHAAREQLQQLVVELVDLRTQFGEALGGDRLVADHQVADDIGQRLGGHLLGLVAPCAVGRAVGFDDQSVEPQIHRLLGNFLNIFPFT